MTYIYLYLSLAKKGILITFAEVIGQGGIGDAVTGLFASMASKALHPALRELSPAGLDSLLKVCASISSIHIEPS